MLVVGMGDQARSLKAMSEFMCVLLFELTFVVWTFLKNFVSNFSKIICEQHQQCTETKAISLPIASDNLLRVKKCEGKLGASSKIYLNESKVLDKFERPQFSNCSVKSCVRQQEQQVMTLDITNSGEHESDISPLTSRLKQRYFKEMYLQSFIWNPGILISLLNIQNVRIQGSIRTKSITISHVQDIMS